MDGELLHLVVARPIFVVVTRALVDIEGHCYVRIGVMADGE